MKQFTRSKTKSIRNFEFSKPTKTLVDSLMLHYPGEDIPKIERFFNIVIKFYLIACSVVPVIQKAPNLFNQKNLKRIQYWDKIRIRFWLFINAKYSIIGTLHLIKRYNETQDWNKLFTQQRLNFAEKLLQCVS